MRYVQAKNWANKKVGLIKENVMNKETIWIFSRLGMVCLFAGAMMYFGMRSAELVWERPPIEISISFKDEGESGSPD